MQKDHRQRGEGRLSPALLEGTSRRNKEALGSLVEVARPRLRSNYTRAMAGPRMANAERRDGSVDPITNSIQRRA